MSISEHLGHAIKRHQSKTKETKEGRSSEKGEINRMTIERAENGFMVTHHKENSEAGPYREPKKHLFKHTEGRKMAKHIQEMMGAAQDPEEDESAKVEGKDSKGRK